MVNESFACYGTFFMIWFYLSNLFQFSCHWKENPTVEKTNKKPCAKYSTVQCFTFIRCVYCKKLSQKESNPLDSYHKEQRMSKQVNHFSVSMRNDRHVQTNKPYGNDVLWHKVQCVKSTDLNCYSSGDASLCKEDVICCV